MNTRVSENGVKSQLRGKPEKEAVETAIGASRTDDGTVQTTNSQEAMKIVVARKSVAQLGLWVRFPPGPLKGNKND